MTKENPNEFAATIAAATAPIIQDGFFVATIHEMLMFAAYTMAPNRNGQRVLFIFNPSTLPEIQTSSGVPTKPGKIRVLVVLSSAEPPPIDPIRSWRRLAESRRRRSFGFFLKII
jgi:hypothetical protein